MVVYLWAVLCTGVKVVGGLQRWNRVGYPLLFKRHFAESRMLGSRLPMVRIGGPEAWDWSKLKLDQ